MRVIWARGHLSLPRLFESTVTRAACVAIDFANGSIPVLESKEESRGKIFRGSKFEREEVFVPTARVPAAREGTTEDRLLLRRLDNRRQVRL
jgi:hypothetical protein